MANQLDKLLAQQERATQKKHEAEQQEKRLVYRIFYHALTLRSCSRLWNGFREPGRPSFCHCSFTVFLLCSDGVLLT